MKTRAFDLSPEFKGIGGKSHRKCMWQKQKRARVRAQSKDLRLIVKI
jgi:hypothetical protein